MMFPVGIGVAVSKSLSRGRQRRFLHPRIAYWSARIAFLCPCAWPRCNALGKLKKFAPLHELVLLPSSLASGSLHCGSNRRLRIFFWILETGIACLNPLFELLVQRDDALDNWRARKHNYLIYLKSKQLPARKNPNKTEAYFCSPNIFPNVIRRTIFLFGPPKDKSVVWKENRIQTPATKLEAIFCASTPSEDLEWNSYQCRRKWPMNGLGFKLPFSLL